MLLVKMTCEWHVNVMPDRDIFHYVACLPSGTFTNDILINDCFVYGNLTPYDIYTNDMFTYGDLTYDIFNSHMYTAICIRLT